MFNLPSLTTLLISAIAAVAQAGPEQEVFKAVLADYQSHHPKNVLRGTAKPSCPDSLDLTEEIDAATTLYYAIVPSSSADANDGLLCARIEVEGEQWVGLGFSTNGKMVGSEAVVGTPDDGKVQKYNLVQGSLFRSAEPMEDSKQTLMDTSLTQEDGITSITFTKKLVEMDEIPILEAGENIFLYARGSSNKLAFHSTFFKFTKDFSDENAGGAPATEAPMASTTGATEAATTASACPATLDMTEEIDDVSTLHYAIVPSSSTDANDGLLCAKLEVEGEQWIGLGFSTNGKMVGSEAVIATPDTGMVKKYNLVQGSLFRSAEEMEDSKQTLMDTTLTQEDGITSMTFTKKLVEMDEIPILEAGENIFLYARGSDNVLAFHNTFFKFTKDFSDDNAGGAPATEAPMVSTTGATEAATTNVATTNAATTKAATTEAASDETPTCPDTLDSTKQIDGAKTLYYAVVPSNPADANNGILCARLEVAAEAWLGFGISEEGLMAPGSQAIIGTPEDGKVMKYNLNSRSQDGVVPMEDAKQTLTGASLTQEDGVTKMTFTKLLMEDDEIPIKASGVNTFLHAHGSGNELSYHAERGSFKMEFADGDTSDATTTVAPVVSTTAATKAAAVTTAATTAASSSSDNTEPADSSATSFWALEVVMSLVGPILATMLLS